MAHEKLPVWDLSALYSGPNDPRILADGKMAIARARKFARRYRGKLVQIAASASPLHGALVELEAILQTAAKPVEYAYLRFSEAATDPARGAMLQNTRERCLEVSRELTFFELELLKVPGAKLKKVANSPSLRRFRNFLLKLLASKPHRLSEREEQILQEKQMTGGSAFTRLFDEEFAAKRYVLRGESLTEAQILDKLHDPNRKVRKEAADGFTKGLKEESRRLTFIFNTILQDKSIDDRLGNFSSPEASRHLANQISQQAVNTMVGEVSRSTSLVARYYKLKRRLLKVDKLFDYDRYAPVGKDRSSDISFSEARALVTDASTKFSPVYADIVDQFFRKRWIHAAATPGKISGAFCSFATADTHPFVLVNYSGTLKEVLTLAHELGHAVHAYLMREKGYINFGVPLTIAETASVFGEMLVFDHLRTEIKNPRQLLSLYCSKIEGVFATVFRQVSMHRFEQSAHFARRSHGELSAAQFCKIWRQHQEEMFEGAVTLTPGYDNWWSYIPHFLHTPFYVYAYAFGELLTVSLYSQYQGALRSGEESKFVARYLEMLSLGDSKSPAELVRPFGISLEKAQFWRGGIKIIEGLLSELEELVE